MHCVWPYRCSWASQKQNALTHAGKISGIFFLHQRVVKLQTFFIKDHNDYIYTKWLYLWVTQRLRSAKRQEAVRFFFPPRHSTLHCCIVIKTQMLRDTKISDSFCFGVKLNHLYIWDATKEIFLKGLKGDKWSFRWASCETLSVYFSCKCSILMWFLAFNPAPNGHQVLQ